MSICYINSDEANLAAWKQATDWSVPPRTPSLTLRGQPPALFWWAVLSGWAVHSPRSSFDGFAEQQARVVGMQTRPMMAGAAQDTARMSRMLSSHYSPPWRC